MILTFIFSLHLSFCCDLLLVLLLVLLVSSAAWRQCCPSLSVTPPPHTHTHKRTRWLTVADDGPYSATSTRGQRLTLPQPQCDALFGLFLKHMTQCCCCLKTLTVIVDTVFFLSVLLLLFLLSHLLPPFLLLLLCSPASPGGPAWRWEGPGQGKQPGSHPSLHGTGCLAHGETHAHTPHTHTLTHCYASIISGTSLLFGYLYVSPLFQFCITSVLN